ncbi:MAG: ATP-binding protein [Candidatus Heimdallarchaeota archaeon]|nr:MAG: ATP-binding protein [Candidatus Heimdallarchaeota archaeon]
MTIIGTVVATSDSPSLENITLILNKDTQSKIERGQFVSISKSNTQVVLGIVTGIKKHNTYYETLDSSVQEIASRNYEAIFPIEEWESTQADVKPLGEINLETRRTSRLKFPVSPGSKVYVATSSVVSKFLGLKKDGIYLGDIPSNNVKIEVDLSRLLRKHLAILAISGAGKSYAASILLEEMLKRSKMSVLVIDPHGEYTSIVPPKSRNTRIEVIKGSYISIGVPELSAWEISEFIPEISAVQTRVLDNVISNLRKEAKPHYSLQDIIQNLERAETINTRTREALVSWLYSLNRTYLFSAESNPNFLEILEPGKIVILDLSDIQNLRSRRIIVLHSLRKLYYQRTRDKIPPSLFVIEEAHQFCPASSRSISKRIIETIAREGRKFYISLCLISQRPVHLSVTALSQCNTNLILRIRNPYDQDFIGKTSEGIDRSSLKMIPDLEIGEALLVGEAINYPTFFRIRSRYESDKDSSLTLEKMANRYENAWRRTQDSLEK